MSAQVDDSGLLSGGDVNRAVTGSSHGRALQARQMKLSGPDLGHHIEPRGSHLSPGPGNELALPSDRKLHFAQWVMSSGGAPIPASDGAPLNVARLHRRREIAFDKPSLWLPLEYLFAHAAYCLADQYQ